MNMKEKYKFYLGRKITIWERDKFEIDANSKEEAISQIKQQFSEEDNAFYIEGESEILYDTRVVLSPKGNQTATIVIFDDETNEIILSNWGEY